MEVEQVVPITTGAPGINGDNVVTVEETEQLANGAAVANEDAIVTNGDAVEPNALISRSASSHEHRQAKKRGAFGLFRAVFMSFSGSGSMKKKDATSEQQKASDKPAAANDAATWKNLVDGMRPLRLHGHLDYYPPPPPRGHDVYHDVLLPPASPERLEGMTSRYASAQDLQQLDGGHEAEAEAEEEQKESDPTEGGDGGGCPNAIDMQAEEFIAKFYAQFRLQKSDSFNNRAE